MAKEYIEREAALAFPFANGQYDRENADPHFINGCESYREWLETIPAADVVELPCRIGDTVWCIRSFRGIDHPQETKVSGMYFTQDMRLNIQCKYVGIGEFGKKVFKTREDAMKAMEGQRA